MGGSDGVAGPFRILSIAPRSRALAFAARRARCVAGPHRGSRSCRAEGLWFATRAAGASLVGDSCDRRPAYQAQVSSARDGRTIRKTFAALTDARAWRAEAKFGAWQGGVGAFQILPLARENGVASGCQARSRRGAFVRRSVPRPEELGTLPFPSLGSSSAKSSSIVASSMVGGTFPCWPSAILRMVERSVLPERVFGSVDDGDRLEGGNRPDGQSLADLSEA
jgi:hypothetical protein